MYTVEVFRHEYVLYMAWEYGIQNANYLLKANPTRRPVFSFKLKRDAASFADRVRQAVCWQRGRLKMSHKCPDVFMH